MPVSHREISKTSCSLTHRRGPQESLLKIAYISEMFSYLALRPTEKSHRRSARQKAATARTRQEAGRVRKLLEVSQIWESLFPE